MSKVFFGILFTSFLFLILIPTFVFAQENLRSDEVATLEKDEVIDSDYFSTGEKVVLSGTVNGDAYIAGGNVIVDGVVNGDLLVAGGNISVLGKVAGDIRAAGGNINISGVVDGNVTTVGGNIDIEQSSNIVGSMVGAGGNIQVFGPIGRGLTVGAGALTINNTVGSDILAGVGEFDLSSNARVNGDIIYASEREINIANDATVSGEVTQHIVPRVDVPKKEGILAAINFGWNLYTFLGTFFVGAILIIFGPNYTRKVVAKINDRPWMSMGIGFLALIITPIIIVLLFITIIGIPLSILLLVYYIFVVMFAKVFTAVFLGGKISGFLGQKYNLFITFLFGLAALSIVGLIPIVGGIISFVAMLAGFGAVVLTKRELFLNLRSKKII